MLGFLSNLRDVKSALSAGMLLLFAVWLLIGEQLAKIAPGDTLAGKVVTLVGYLGPAATLAVITFVAYVVGLVLPFHSIMSRGINRYNRKMAARGGDKTRDSRLLDFIQDQVKRAASKKPLDELTRELTREIPALTKMSIRYPWWIRFSPRCKRSRLERLWNRAIVHRAMKRQQPDDKEAPEGRFAKYRAERTKKKVLALILLRRIYSESALLAVDLGQKDDKAYERFAKARSESEFRSGLCIPLLILTAVIALQLPADQFPWGAAGVFAVGFFSVLVLVLRAIHKAQEAQEEVNSAIILGRIKVPELQILEAAINVESTINAPPPGRRSTILRALVPKK